MIAPMLQLAAEIKGNPITEPCFIPSRYKQGSMRKVHSRYVRRAGKKYHVASVDT